MVQKIGRVAFYIVAIVLLACMPIVALAAPDRQTGGQNGDTSPSGENQQGETGQSSEAGRAQPAGLTQSSALTCSTTHVVQANESLSEIANRYYGDPLAYTNIVQLNNDMAGSNNTYTTISNPNFIRVGQTLCIASPSRPTVLRASITMQDTNNNLTTMPGLNLAPGQGAIIVENFTGDNIVFDVTQPRQTSSWIGPDKQQLFMLEVGTYSYKGHHPTGQFSISPGEFKITSGQVTRLVCFQSFSCREIPLAQWQQGSSRNK